MWNRPDPAGQLWASFSYSQNPINTVDPSGAVIENVDVEQFGEFQSTLSAEEFNFYMDNYANVEEVFQWSDIFTGFQVLQEGRQWIGTWRVDEVRAGGFLGDCSGTACLILNASIGTDFTEQRASSWFRTLPQAQRTTQTPGTIVTYNGHVGFYDPFGGGQNNELLSMPGSSTTPRQFGYRPVNASWWTGRRYVEWPQVQGQ
jgi:hypothetical protein